LHFPPRSRRQLLDRRLPLLRHLDREPLPHTRNDPSSPRGRREASLATAVMNGARNVSSTNRTLARLPQPQYALQEEAKDGDIVRAQGIERGRRRPGSEARDASSRRLFFPPSAFPRLTVRGARGSSFPSELPTLRTLPRGSSCHGIRSQSASAPSRPRACRLRHRG